MKLRREVDLQTFRAVTKEMDAALDQLVSPARNSL